MFRVRIVLANEYGTAGSEKLGCLQTHPILTVIDGPRSIIAMITGCKRRDPKWDA